MPTHAIYYFLVILVTSFTDLHAQQRGFSQIAPGYDLEYIPMPELDGKFSIRSIAEDKYGFIWLATNCGLLCWDGQNVITYSGSNSRFQLPFQSTDFASFATDQNGILYNYQEGYNQFDPYQRSCKKITGLSPKDQTQADGCKFSVADDGTLFIVMYFNQSSKIFRREGDRYVPILKRHFLYKTDKIDFAFADNKIIVSKNDSIYIHNNGGTTLKKIYLPGHKFVTWCNYNSPKYPAVFLDQASKKLFAFNTQTLELDVFADLSTVPFNTVNRVAAKDSLILLAGNLQLRLINVAARNYQDLSGQLTDLLKKNYPLNLNTIGATGFVCRNGNIFLWTENVLIRLRKKQPLPSKFIETVIDKHQQPSLSFRALAEDEGGNIYASYYSGIAKKSAGKGSFNWINFPLVHELKDQGVYGLSYQNGALYWNNVKIDLSSLNARFLIGNKFAGHTTLLKQGDSLWLYPWLENKLYLHSIKSGTTKMVADFSGLAIDNITEMVADPDGKHIWFSSDRFIVQIDKKGVITKSWNAQEMQGVYGQVHCLRLDKGRLWFGTDNGLGVLNVSTLEVKLFKNLVTSRAGSVKDLVVFSMLPYQDSLMYIGGNIGIHLFNTNQNTWYSLDKNHPLAQVEFNRSSTLLASGGKCYFGSIDGLYSFYPNELPFAQTTTNDVTLHLVNISWYDQNKKQIIGRWENLNNVSLITLGPQPSNLELVFSVPQFDHTIFYDYRLPGVNDQWQGRNTSGKINIGTLLPGNYTIEVKAYTSINDENPAYYSIKLVIEEYWYKKWWAKAVLFLLFAGATWWYVKQQIKKRLQRQQEAIKRQEELAALRTKISSDLHDDVGSILTGLAMQSQNIAVESNDKTKQELDEIVEMSREAMERMRDTVWVIDSRKDKYINLIDRMRSSAEQQLATKNINHHFEADLENPDEFIDPIRRQNVYLIFKELISNILKHSDATQVHIKFVYRKKQLYLLVHDNGTIQKQKTTDGLGLSNIALRAKNIKGTFTTQYENGFKAELWIDN